MLLYSDLLAEHGGQILNYCCMIGVDLDTTRSLVQEVNIAIWLALDRLDPSSSPRQVNRWIQKVMRHTIYDYCFRRRRISTQPLDNTIPLPAPDNADRELLDELVSYLPADDRLLMQQLLDGYSRAEIAAADGITRNAVDQRVHRIVNKMKTIYSKLYETEH